MKTILFSFIFCLVSVCLSAQAGSFDSSFSGNGKVITHFNKQAALHTMALQADGKIIAVGTVDSLFTLVRYNTNGSTDKGFGNNGIVTGMRGEANAVAIQDNGNIIVAGTTSKQHGYKINYNVTVAQYNSNGSIDSGFGNNGSVTVDVHESDYCKAVAVQQDEKIVLAGTTNGKVLLIRLNKDGSYDTNFGDSGKATAYADKYGWTITSTGIRTIALQTDGKIIVGGVGTDNNGTDDLYTVLMRFKRNGPVDTSFGYDGRADFRGINVYDIAVQSDGKIVCAGSYHHIVAIDEEDYYYVDDPALARYTADGFIDTTYSGYVSGFSDDGNQSADLYSVALLPDDKSVSTLQYSYSAESDTTLAVLRYNTKGKKDLAFGTTGEKVFTNPYLQRNTTPSTPILVQPDGKIVVGSTHDSSGFYIARLLGSNVINKNITSAAQAVKIANVQAGVYPNPAHNILTIKGLSSVDNYQLVINNSKGSVVATKQVSNATSYQFNVRNLISGVYYLNVVSGNKIITTLKFVKE